MKAFRNLKVHLDLLSFLPLRQVQTEEADKSCVTFVLHNEDHTFGNALRYMIMKE